MSKQAKRTEVGGAGAADAAASLPQCSKSHEVVSDTNGGSQAEAAPSPNAVPGALGHAKQVADVFLPSSATLAQANRAKLPAPEAALPGQKSTAEVAHGLRHEMDATKHEDKRERVDSEAPSGKWVMAGLDESG